MQQFLEERGAAALLDDPLMATATAEIESSDRPRHAIQADLKRKEAARKLLGKRHSNSKCSPDEILDAIYSFSDNNTYLLFNRDPVERMIGYLKEFFSPKDEGGYSLAISTGAVLALVCTIITMPYRRNGGSWQLPCRCSPVPCLWSTYSNGAAAREHCACTTAADHLSKGTQCLHAMQDEAARGCRTITSASTPTCCSRCRCGARSPQTCSACGTLQSKTSCQPTQSTACATLAKGSTASRCESFQVK